MCSWSQQLKPFCTTCSWWGQGSLRIQSRLLDMSCPPFLPQAGAIPSEPPPISLSSKLTPQALGRGSGWIFAALPCLPCCLHQAPWVPGTLCDERPQLLWTVDHASGVVTSLTRASKRGSLDLLSPGFIPSESGS